MQLTPLEVFKFFFWNENESLEMTVPIHKDSQQKKKVKIQLQDAILSKWSETGQRSGCLQCELFSMTTPINVQFCRITTREQRTRHMSLMKIRKKSSHKHPASLQPQLMPGSLCTGLTHPTTLSFGTLWSLLPAPANLPSVLSFLLIFICDSSFPSKSKVYKWNHSKQLPLTLTPLGTRPVLSALDFPFSELTSSVNYEYSTDQVPKFTENGLSVCLLLPVFHPTKTLAWVFNLCSDLNPEQSTTDDLRWNL